MAFKTEAATVLPAVGLLALASYLAVLAMQITDPGLRDALLIVGLGCFFGGLVVGTVWFYYWAVRQGFPERRSR